MSEADQSERTGKNEQYLKFVGRIYRMRSMGLGAGCVAVGGVLYENHVAWPWWVLLVFNGYIWPSIAYWLARRSRDPRRMEMWSLLVDSAAGGMWIAAMQFNLLVSALLVVMLSADKVGVGGWKFLARAATAQLIACLVTGVLIGFRFKPETTMFEILLSLPFMLVYPLALSTVAYALGRKVARQNRVLDRLSRIDPLTELFNRRQLEDAASVEFARRVRSGRHAALLLLDIDHFKQINDTYGHPFGDRVLKQLAAILLNSIRDIDTAGRFGGDEFGIVLTEASLADAVEVAERIRTSVQTMFFSEAPELRCTVSIGVAAADSELQGVGDWIRGADVALYRAKQGGRDKIAVHNAAGTLGSRERISAMDD